MAKEKKEEKNIHEGHRARLLDMVCKAGLDNVGDITALEFFLTYIFPRGNTNPLAHRLLEQYETFTHILEAPAEDLMQVKGLNKRSAQMISMFNELFFHYSSAKMGKKFKINAYGEIVDLIEDCLRFRTTENIILLGISPAGFLTHRKRIESSSMTSVGMEITELTRFLSYANPDSFVMAHCHPYGSATPSEADEQTYQTVKNICQNCGINFLGSYIVGEEGVFGQKEKCLVRKYVEIEKLKMPFKVES